MPPSSQAGAPEAGKKDNSAHIHAIELEDLIVHKYDAHDALMQKADKLARDLIHEELRDGEMLQVLGQGSYLVHLPKLTPAAGELRCSLMTEKIYRAIRDLNPAAKKFKNNEHTPPPAPTKTPEPRVTRAAPPSTPQRPIAKNGQPSDSEMAKLAASAMAAMTGPSALSREELLNTEFGRAISASLTLQVSPMWYPGERVIIGHDCVPVHEEMPLRNISTQFRESGLSTTDICAIIDTITYEKAVETIKKNQLNGASGLIVCPVHVSTLMGQKYVPAFLGAGQNVTPQMSKYLLFLVKGWSPSVSRIHVRDVAGYLRPRCRALLADLHLSTKQISPFFKEFGFHAVRTTVVDLTYPEAQTIKMFDEFMELSEKAKLLATVDGIDKQSLAIAALASGFKYLSGTAIERKTDADAGIQDFDVDHLFQ